MSVIYRQNNMLNAHVKHGHRFFFWSKAGGQNRDGNWEWTACFPHARSVVTNSSIKKWDVSQQWAVPGCEAVGQGDEDGRSGVPVLARSLVVRCGPILRGAKGSLRAAEWDARISLQRAEGCYGHGPGKKQVQRVFTPECPVGRVGFPWDGSLRKSCFSPCSWLGLSPLLPFASGFVCLGPSHPRLFGAFIPAADHRAGAVQPGSGLRRGRRWQRGWA